MACVKKIRGKYRADFRDRAGKRYRKFFTTKKAADDWLDKRKVEVKEGTFIAPKEIPTFKEVAEDWFAGKRNYRPASLLFWRTHLDRHLLPALGDMRLDQIDVKTVERFRDERHDSGLAPQTVNKILTTATAVLRFARKRKLCTGNVAEDADRMRLDAGEIVDGKTERRSGRDAVREEDILNPQEIQRLLQHADAGFYRTLFMTAALTGMRHDELLALQWGDFDLEAGKVAVRRSLSWARLPHEELRPRFFEPKTAAGRRTIPLAPELVTALKAWKLRCPPNSAELVFPKPDGEPIHRGDVLRYGLYPALRRAELRRVDMHSLRHSFASALIAGGAPVTEVQHLMGHAKPTTTLQVYSHWFKKTETSAVANLAKMVCGQLGHQMDTKTTTGENGVRVSA